MLFNTAQFAIFFLIVLVGHRSLSGRAKNAWLLAASLLFYVLWYPAYLLLLLFDVVVNYALLRAIVTSSRPKLFLSFSITFTLSLLMYFKYAAFLVAGVVPFLGDLGTAGAGWTNIVLPLGISFYSFQIIALAVDTYRRHVEPPDGLARYTLFVTFFPQLIAGPILRGSEFLPQLESGGTTTRARTQLGIWLIACGLLKKVVFGDYLLAPFVNEVFANPGIAPATVHLIAVYSFAFQIYFDFSGYTDIARGLAAVLGYDLPLNFKEPYLSRNPTEFWRRWHITLSTWLRDYLYIPLGGNRFGTVGTYRNLFLTMLLGGLWHGAGWLFAIWGGLHGALLALHRALPGERPSTQRGVTWRDAGTIALTFHLVCFLWIFFRAATFADATQIIETLATGSYWAGWPLLPTIVIGVCWLAHVAERLIRPHARNFVTGLQPTLVSGMAQGLVLGAILALAIAASGTGAEFIYFQF